MSSARTHFESTRSKDVMTRDVVTVYANQQMSTASQELLDNRITGVPVVSYEETCVGILSSKDFLRRNPDEFEGDQVFSYMTAPPITVSEDHTLLDVAVTLRSNRIHRVPVVDDRGRVTGIISTLDILDQVIQTIGEEAPQAVGCDE